MTLLSVDRNQIRRYRDPVTSFIVTVIVEAWSLISQLLRKSRRVHLRRFQTYSRNLPRKTTPMSGGYAQKAPNILQIIVHATRVDLGLGMTSNHGHLLPKQIYSKRTEALLTSPWGR